MKPGNISPEMIMAHHPTPPPFERSYWVIPGRFLAGYYPGDRDELVSRNKLSALLVCGVQKILNLMAVDEMNGDGEPFAPYDALLAELASEQRVEVTCQRFPVTVQDVPTWQQMRIILDSIDHSLANGEVVYVHDWDGRGRTGTVVGCFIARHQLAMGRGVVGKIAALRSDVPDRAMPSPESEAQIRMVSAWRGGE